MRRDERLIDLFLGNYKDRDGQAFRLVERPDRMDRAKPAIDCVAVSERGTMLAVEHTLVEPFEGQKADDQPFLAVFEQLHHAPKLAVPNLLINVLAPVGAVPKGVDWGDVRERITSWFQETRFTLRPGESDHRISGLPFDLSVLVETTEVPDTPGVVVVGRVAPKGRLFSEMLRRALTAKLPKLVATPANRHILLLEDASMILGLTQFARGIDEARGDFPKLAEIDSVWLAFTAVWDTDKTIFFFQVWPNGVTDRFTVEDT